VKPPDCTLADLVHQLLKLPPGELTLDRVTPILADRPIRAASLQRFIQFRDDKYARNLVYRCEDFEMLVLCWQPGHMTPVHNHAGQCGWVRVLRGAIQETDYDTPDWMRGGLIPPGRIEIDDDGVGHGIDLIPHEPEMIAAGDIVSAVDRRRSIHRLGNPREANERAITLHVYARPHDSCLAFDVDERTCRQITLRPDTVPTAPLS